MGRGGLEEFGDGNALATDELLGRGVMGFTEGGDAGKRSGAEQAEK